MPGSRAVARRYVTRPRPATLCYSARMCGIAGVYRTTSHEDDRAVVLGMLKTLELRGPDDQGLESDGPVAFGHRRLAILDLSAAGDEKIHIYGIIFLSVRVARQRRHKTYDVSRTAGTAEPGASLIFAVAGKRIRVEKLVTAQRNAGEKTVVDNPFQNVDILCVAVEQRHPMVPHGVGDGGTGFAIGRCVRQLIVFSEGFTAAPGADSAGDIHLSRNDVPPYPTERFDVARIAR